jgi:hypothetical protein
MTVKWEILIVWALVIALAVAGGLYLLHRQNMAYNESITDHHASDQVYPTVTPTPAPKETAVPLPTPRPVRKPKGTSTGTPTPKYAINFCGIVRWYVKVSSEAALDRRATELGYTQAQIANAHRCLRAQKGG